VEAVRSQIETGVTLSVVPGQRHPPALCTKLATAYCAGLRLGKLARLNLADVDLQVGTITIRETTFFKSRILPLADTALTALREYLDARVPTTGKPTSSAASSPKALSGRRTGVRSSSAPKPMKAPAASTARAH
jgi:integrase